MDIDDIEWLWKDDNSGGGGCPSLMRVPGGYLGIGREVPEELRSLAETVAAKNNSGIGPGESVLFYPSNVIDKIKDEDEG